MLKWFRRRRRSTEKPSVAPSGPDLRQALEKVERGMEQARERDVEIHEIARTLRLLREQNHFAPLVRDALGGRERT